MPILGPVIPETLAAARDAARSLKDMPLIVLYLGPDQIMPFASVLSAIVGLALMFWNRLVAVVTKGWAVLTRRGRHSEGDPPVEDRA